MPKVIPFDAIRLSDTAWRFDGRDHGTTVSFFVMDYPPGKRVALHRHPYEETFIVQAGTATFTVDGETFETAAGHVVMVPAGAAHGFINNGQEPLRQVSIHPADHVMQEWLED